MICDAGPERTGGRISPISRDGQLVGGFGIRSGTPSVLVRSEEPCAGLLGGGGGALGDADRLGVVSQSIRLEVVSYV